MSTKYFEDQTFTQLTSIANGDYDNCTFESCDFTEMDLSDFKFIDCEFIECNLSMVRTYRTVFRDAIFSRCKLLGLKFETCSNFGLSFRFDNCLLNFSSFYQTELQKTKFNDCKLTEVDFSECNLTDSIFENYDLSGSLFQKSNLDKVDFRTAYNYSINLEVNRCKKAKFSSLGISGLLEQYDIKID